MTLNGMELDALARLGDAGSISSIDLKRYAHLDAVVHYHDGDHEGWMISPTGGIISYRHKDRDKVLQ